MVQLFINSSFSGNVNHSIKQLLPSVFGKEEDPPPEDWGTTAGCLSLQPPSALLQQITVGLQ